MTHSVDWHKVCKIYPIWYIVTCTVKAKEDSSFIVDYDDNNVKVIARTYDKFGKHLIVEENHSINIGDSITGVVVDHDQVKNIVYININQEAISISLSAENNHYINWRDICSKYPIGYLGEGTVIIHANFGIFLELSTPQVRGLIEVINFLDGDQIMKPDMFPKVGEKVTAVVIWHDHLTNQVRFSLKPSALSFANTF